MTTTTKTKRRVIWLLALSAVVACMHGGQSPTPGGTLAPGSERRPRADAGAFRVVFAGPEGEAPAQGEISVVFSRPLRSLEVDAPPPPIKIDPPIDGKWLWVGGRALRFVPATTRLPAATEFKVQVPAGIAATDGTKLAEAHHFSFHTQRPSLVRSEPSDGSEGHLPQTKLDLYFNQGIDPVELERHAKLEVVGGNKPRQVAFKAARLDPKEPKRVEITPSQPLPLASTIRLSIDDKLVGLEGKLASGRSQSVSVQTYGPLRVERFQCYSDNAPGGGCVPGSSIGVELTNGIKHSDLKRFLSVTPPVALRWPDASQEEEGTTRWLTLSGPFKAATSYTFRIDPALRDEHGQPLSGGFGQTVRYGDYFSELQIGIAGEALEPSRARAIPLGYRNVASFDLVKARLDPGKLQTVVHDTTSNILQRLRALPGASAENVKSSVARNQIGRREVDPASVVGARGVFAVGASYRDPSSQQEMEQGRVVKLSDLALTAKLSRFGSTFWVTRLSTGQAVPGADLELLPETGKKKAYRADQDGFVRVPASDFAPNFEDYEHDMKMLAVARSGDDWTFERIGDHLSPWRLPVPVDLAGRLDTYGLIFTERGVYRPGDEVLVKGIVRDETATGNSTPKGRSYELLLYSSDEEELSKQNVTASEFGTFSAKLKVPATGQLGTYKVLARTSQKTGTLSAYFDVAEYRPAEFEVTVDAREREVVRGADPGFSVRGDYLYGAPMAGSPVTYSFAREPAYVSLPGHEAFVADSRVYYDDLAHAALGAGGLKDGEGVLATDGVLKLAQRLELPDQRYPERVLLSTEVTDATRQAVGAQGSVLVHPASFYVAVKSPEDYFFEAPKKFAPEVVAVTPKGDRLSGKRVSLELVKRRWTYTRQDLGGGESHAVSKPVDQVVSRCSFTTGPVPGGCELSAREGGYYLVVAKSQDEQKRAVEAAIGLYGLGAGEFGWGDNDRAMLEIVPNKKRYRVGETAKFLIKSPFKEAEAWVTVERAGVYRSERVKVRGATPTVSVPVTAELAPNAFVSVHLIVPRGAAKTEPLGPAYRFGYAELPIDPEARRLSVTVKPLRADLKPGEEAEVELEVKDRAGKPALSELAVYAVDEGVLMLTGYRTPDPVPVFGAPRALAVATLETREGLAKISLSDFMMGEDKGMEGGGGGLGATRSDFRQVALFEPRVLTDARGKAKVRFKLPHSLTSYRVMAVAVSSDDRYGFGDSRVTASKPLMVRPALPRFLRAGDVLEAAAVIAAKGISPGRVTVRAEVTGARLEGPAEQSLELAKDASGEVRFKLRAPEVGNVKIAFVATSSVARDAVTLERRVQTPATLETVAVYGETKESVNEKLGDLGKLRSDVGGLEVALASSSLIGVDAGMEELVEYPYACTEQLASRLLPLGPLSDLARAFDLELPKNAQSIRDKTIAEILTRQRGDGGFGMWPGSPDSSDWVTPYALWVLEETRRSGAHVPKSAFDRGRDYLRRWLSRYVGERPETAAFAVDVLATLGTPDHGYAEKLWTGRAELPLFSRGLLLHALSVGKAPEKMRDALQRELENALRVSGNSAKVVENLGDEYAALMDSPTRTNAIVLRALLASKPDHPLAGRLARGLLDARERGKWRSTQETAFTLLALDAYRRNQEKDSPDFSAKALLGERALATLEARGKGLFAQNASLPFAGLKGAERGIVLQKDGGGTLFYELRLKYAPRTLPSSALDAGFFVKKVLRAVKSSELSAALENVPETGTTRFSAGDLVIADLLIVAPSPSNYVVIDDPLPAGLEAIDANLRTTASWLAVPSSSGDVSPHCPGCDAGAEDELAHGRAYIDVWHRRELRDDRALFFVDAMPAGMYHFRYLARATSIGTFVVPPTKAEEMYEPETYGRTAATLVEVR